MLLFSQTLPDADFCHHRIICLLTLFFFKLKHPSVVGVTFMQINVINGLLKVILLCFKIS